MSENKNNKALSELSFFSGYRIVIGFMGYPVNKFCYSIYNNKGDEVSLEKTSFYSVENAAIQALNDLRKISKSYDLNIFHGDFKNDE